MVFRAVKEAVAEEEEEEEEAAAAEEVEMLVGVE